MHTALKRQVQVLHALAIHDIKARFFGNGLGYIVMILWPASHLMIIVAAFYIGGRVAPYGNDRLLYACIGVLPYIYWSYISRFTMLGMITNRAFLNYPAVKPLDLMFARQGLELVSCTIITICMALVLMASGTSPMPLHLEQAAFALASAALLGLGFGIFHGVIVMIIPMWNLVYVAFLVGFWFTAGLVFDPESLPGEVGYIFSWNPVMHSVEWLRLAYYPDFPARLLDRNYVLTVGFGSLAVGLLMEYILRPITTRSR